MKQESKKQKETKIWIYGKHTCGAAIENKKKTIHEAIITENMHCMVKNKLESKKTKIVPREQMNKIALKIFGSTNITHQGIILNVEQSNPLQLEPIIYNKKKSIILCLDRISDIHNIGSIIRSSAAFAIEAIVITTHKTAQINSFVHKIASGAIEEVNIVQVVNLAQTIKILKKNGYWTYGLSAKGSQSIHETQFAHKSAIIIGSEDKGIRKHNESSCDFLIKIPIKIESLNAAQAATVALYEAKKQLGN